MGNAVSIDSTQPTGAEEVADESRRYDTSNHIERTNTVLDTINQPRRMLLKSNVSANIADAIIRVRKWCLGNVIGREG
jgi:hypothetical protein